MTDSVKLCAFSETPMAWPLVSGIGTLQAEVGAGARVASRRPFQVPLPPAADIACPSGLGEEVQDVGTAQQPDHLAAADHRDAADSFSDQKARGFVDPGLLGDRD